jgi:hypothetical protein
MKFTETVSASFGIAFGTAISYGVGFVYGAMWGLNKTMAARAFAVSSAASLSFEVLAKVLTGGKKGDAGKYYALKLVGGTGLAALQIAAFRQLNLIGTLGTAFLAFNATILALDNLYGYFHKS